MADYEVSYTPTPPGYRGSYSASPSTEPVDFDPSDVVGMLIDWNADSIVGSDGDMVSAWVNDAPTGATGDLAQATEAKRPLLKKGVNGINSLNTVLFDGVDDWMSSAYMTPAAAMTVFIVSRAPTSAAINRHVLTFRDVSGFNYAFLRYVTYAGYEPYNFGNKMSGGAFNPPGIADAVGTSAQLFSWTYNNGTISDMASYTAALGSTAKTVIASDPHTPTAGILTSLGAMVSSVSVGSLFAPINVSRVLAYSDVLSAGDLASIRSYLATRYAL